MVKYWNNAMKRLLADSPQDFLNWLMEGAHFTGKRSHEFESRTLEADVMHEVIFRDKRMLFHLEFQSGPDRDMDLRLLEYCVLAYRHYRCPVYSIVIYLKKGSRIASSPFIMAVPDPQLIKLAKKQVRAIEETELLEDLLIKIALASTQEEAQNVLLACE